MVYVSDPLLASLAAAVAAAPADLPLRLHYAQLLLGAGQHVEALTEAATVIRTDPTNEQAQELLAAATAALRGQPAPEAGPAPETPPGTGVEVAESASPPAREPAESRDSTALPGVPAA